MKHDALIIPVMIAASWLAPQVGARAGGGGGGGSPPAIPTALVLARVARTGPNLIGADVVSVLSAQAFIPGSVDVVDETVPNVAAAPVGSTVLMRLRWYRLAPMVDPQWVLEDDDRRPVIATLTLVSGSDDPKIGDAQMSLSDRRQSDAQVRALAAKQAAAQRLERRLGEYEDWWKNSELVLADMSLGNPGGWQVDTKALAWVGPAVRPPLGPVRITGAGSALLQQLARTKAPGMIFVEPAPDAAWLRRGPPAPPLTPQDAGVVEATGPDDPLADTMVNRVRLWRQRILEGGGGKAATADAAILAPLPEEQASDEWADPWDGRAVVVARVGEPVTSTDGVHFHADIVDPISVRGLLPLSLDVHYQAGPGRRPFDQAAMAVVSLDRSGRDHTWKLSTAALDFMPGRSALVMVKDEKDPQVEAVRKAVAEDQKREAAKELAAAQAAAEKRLDDRLARYNDYWKDHALIELFMLHDSTAPAGAISAEYRGTLFTQTAVASDLKIDTKNVPEATLAELAKGQLVVSCAKKVGEKWQLVNEKVPFAPESNGLWLVKSGEDPKIDQIEKAAQGWEQRILDDGMAVGFQDAPAAPATGPATGR